MTKLTPLHNLIVVEKEEDATTSSGGIHLPVPDKDKPCIGKVLSVGPGIYTEHGNFVHAGVEVGDRIAYTMSHQKTFKIDNEEVTCVMASGVLGKVN